MTSVEPAAEDRACVGTPTAGTLIAQVAARVADLAQAVRELERLVDPGTAAGGPAQAHSRSDAAAEPGFEQFARAANLTGREAEVLRHLLDGHSNRRISRSLHISESTVKNHLHAIFVKLDTRDRTQLIAKAYRFLAEHSAASVTASAQVSAGPAATQPEHRTPPGDTTA